MQEYNDYVQATREYLKRYHEFKAIVNNLNDEIEAQEKLLSLSPAVYIPKYGDDTRGGKGEFTATEVEAAKRIAIQEDIERKKLEVERIERIKRKIDHALEALPEQDRQLVEGFYFEHKTWKELSIEYFMTEKWASIKGSKAVKRMACMIFGSTATPGQHALFSKM